MAPLSILQYLKDQWTTIPVPPKQDLTEKTIIVVGANIGLGLEASRHLAAMEPGQLILACRNVQKGEDALKDIQSTTGCKSLKVWQLDLSDFASISAFVDRFEKEGGGRLDLMLENAGIATDVYEQTKDGWESTLQVNHLGTALLAILLLPTLSKSPKSEPFPRLTIVSSETHYFVKRIKEADSENVLKKLNDKEHCTFLVMAQRYPITKRMLQIILLIYREVVQFAKTLVFNIFFTRALAARLLDDTPVTVNTLTPGYCHSALNRNMTGLQLFLDWLLRSWLGRTTEVGGRVLVHASISGTQKEMQGRYLNTCRVEEESDYVISEEGKKMQDRIWKETIEVLLGVNPRVKDIISQYLKSD